MTIRLDGAVGMRDAKTNVRNLASDQRKVISLLAAIGDEKGGKRGAWSSPPPAPGDGACSWDLRNAIWDFQTYWKERGVFHNIDGVVDPFGHTLRHKNFLAPAGSAGGYQPIYPGYQADPPQPADPDPLPLNPLVGAMQQMFSYRTPWEFSSSGGISASVAVLSGGVGTIYLTNAADNSEGKLFLGGAGGGKGPLPAGLSYSTRSMWSSSAGCLCSRTSAPIQPSDMSGPAIVLSLGFSVPMEGDSPLDRSLTLYLLGVNNVAGYLSMLQPVSFLGGLVNAASSANAMGMIFGSSTGIDAGANIWSGYATATTSFLGSVIADIIG